MSGAGEEDKKPAEAGGAHINLKVKGQVSSPAVPPSSSSSLRRCRLALLNPPSRSDRSSLCGGLSESQGASYVGLVGSDVSVFCERMFADCVRLCALGLSGWGPRFLAIDFCVGPKSHS